MRTADPIFFEEVNGKKTYFHSKRIINRLNLQKKALFEDISGNVQLLFITFSLMKLTGMITSNKLKHFGTHWMVLFSTSKK